jgi:hypothetical protein
VRLLGFAPNARPVHSVHIPSSIAIVADHVFFFACARLLSVTFEPGPKLQRIEEDWAFFDCSPLHSACIPSSVEILGDWCFAVGAQDWILAIEDGSNLSRIEPSAFSGCSNLRSSCIFASVEPAPGGDTRTSTRDGGTGGKVGAATEEDDSQDPDSEEGGCEENDHEDEDKNQLHDDGSEILLTHASTQW